MPHNKRKKWSYQEDRSLKTIIREYGNDNWKIISEKMKEKNFNRNPKQCRERWNNQVNPMINHSPWTNSEIELFYELYKEKGNHWCEISKYMPGRTENQVKQYAYNNIKTKKRDRSSFIYNDNDEYEIKKIKKEKEEINTKINHSGLFQEDLKYNYDKFDSNEEDLLFDYNIEKNNNNFLLNDNSTLTELIANSIKDSCFKQEDSCIKIEDYCFEQDESCLRIEDTFCKLDDILTKI